MIERVCFSTRPGALGVTDARIAALGWLVARRDGGALLLRIDDLGGQVPHEEPLLGDLRWLGLDWDEGPGADGSRAPYRRSAGSVHYERALLELRRRSLVYPCFCSSEPTGREHVESGGARASLCRDGCRELDTNDALRRLDAGERAVWRFAVPAGRSVEWADRVLGKASFSSEEIADFAVTDAEGDVLRELADVVDDASMRVTLVVRDGGELQHAPRQLLLCDALGLDAPRFAHVPPPVADSLAVPAPASSADGAIGELRDAGFLPDAVVEYLARLGWSDPLDRAALTREELVAAFDLARVSSAPPRHDLQLLRSLNARHMRALPTEDLIASIAPFLPPLPDWADIAVLAEAARPDLQVASDAYALAEGLLVPRPATEREREALRSPAGRRALDVAYDAVTARGRYDGKAAYARFVAGVGEADLHVAASAARAALTGRTDGLPLPALFSLLGRDRTAERIDGARAAATIDTSEGGNG